MDEVAVTTAVKSDMLASLADEVSDLQAATRELAERQSRLEGEREGDQRSLVRRFSAGGTALALVISLVTGLYTIYDQVVAKPGEARMAKQEELRRVAEALNQLQEDYVFKVLPLTAPAQREQAQRVLNTRSELLLQKGRTLIGQLGDDVGLAELLVIGYFESSRGNLAGARGLFERALAKGAVSELTGGDIYAQLGQFYMQPGPEQNLSRARDYYRQGLDVLSARNDPALVYSRAQLQAGWGFWEMAAAGDKKRGCELWGMAKANVEGLPPLALQNVRYTVDALTEQMQQAGC